MRRVFVCVQHVLPDVRPLLAQETWRTLKPTFSLGYSGEEFVRSLGPVRVRRRGAPDDWPGEGVYCDARRAYRFRDRAVGHWPVDPRRTTRFRVAFRRYFSDGETVGRIESGFVRRTPAHEEPLLGDTVAELVAAALELPVRVRGGSTLECPLGGAGSGLAARLLDATTRWCAAPDGFRPQQWWIGAAPVMALVEYVPGEVQSLPRGAVRAQAELPVGTVLHHVRLDYSAGTARVWLLEVEPPTSAVELRELRLHLMRLNAERESIRRVIRLLSTNELPLRPEAVTLRRLVGYLERAAGFLGRRTVYGHDQSALLRAAYGAEDLISAAERRGLGLRVAELSDEASAARAAEQIEAATDKATELAGSFPLQ